ncbi:MAG: hypothetical protein ABSF12_17125 [Bryobacteraceae bacterium]
MTSFQKPTSVAVDDQSSASKSRFLPFFLVIGIILILLAAAEVIRYHEISKGIALFGAGALALLAVAILSFTAEFCGLGARRITRCTLAAVTISWGVWTALIAYTHHIDAWDEGAYVLSGMALRGYDVPYAAHRPPVTGFICAAFVGWDRLLNPVLLSVLLIVVYLWVRRLLGPFYAALSLFVLLCQNLLLESTVDIMSELPAALLLLVAFFSLARERFWWSAMWFALVVFTRWNLAPVWAVVCGAVLIRFGMRQALKFLGVGLIVFCAWYALTIAMGTPNPLRTVYEGNFLPGVVWGATLEQGLKPDFLLTLDFYSNHFLFLTQPVFFLLIANPIHNLGKHLRTELWIILVVLPLALLAYIVTMLTIGWPVARYLTPLIPSAVVSLLVGLSKVCDDFSLPEPSRVRIVTVVLFLMCAVGLWPLFALVEARVKHNAHPAFSTNLRKELIALDRKVPLHGVPREPLSRANGYPAMVEARHRIFFPSARRDSDLNVVEEPDSVESVRRLAAACHSGDLMLIPKRYAVDFQPAAVLFSDGQWALVRNP